MSYSIQLYTLRTPLEQDLAETIKRVAEIGFSQVEPYNAAAKKGVGYSIRVGYHNHQWELESTIEGRTALEYFADLLDPELVHHRHNGPTARRAGQSRRPGRDQSREIPRSRGRRV